MGATDVNGKPKIEVRIGAIYSLGRIARASDSELIPALTLLNTYVRTQVPRTGEHPKPLPKSEDNQAAINVLGEHLLGTRSFGNWILEDITF